MIWLILGGFSLVVLLASNTSIEGSGQGSIDPFAYLPDTYRKMAQNAVSTGDPIVMSNTANALEVAGYKDAAEALRRMALTARK